MADEGSDRPTVLGQGLRRVFDVEPNSAFDDLLQALDVVGFRSDHAVAGGPPEGVPRVGSSK